MRATHFVIIALASLTMHAGCQTTNLGGTQYARTAMLGAIKTEEPGNYFIGRRYYKKDYKFWGFVRKPGESWSQAKLVMLNEQQRLAPDREGGDLGSDNNYEYKLYGHFSGDTVYEPASNGKYPEFVLKSFELRSKDPANIYRQPGATDPARRIIARPY